MTAEPQSDQPSGIPPPIGVLPDPGIPDPPWRRLAPGMLLVEPVRELIRFIPMLIVLIFAGRVGDTGPPWGLVATGAVIALGISPLPDLRRSGRGAARRLPAQASHRPA